jgi:mutual gliding-motility protein MglA
MVAINFSRREIVRKVVYYGPGLAGKTTNLTWIHTNAPSESRGELTTIACEGDPVLFFDCRLPDVDVGGLKPKFQLYAVPGESPHPNTLKLVLQGCDGVAFVADARPERMPENLASFAQLEHLLREQGLDPETLPMVVQWNKRDLHQQTPATDRDALNRNQAQTFDAVATTGDGVQATFDALIELVVAWAKEQYSLSPTPKRKPAPRPRPPAPPKKPAPEPKRMLIHGVAEPGDQPPRASAGRALLTLACVAVLGALAFLLAR